jgi:hypothetical protein
MAAPTSPDDNLDQLFTNLANFVSETQSPTISAHNAAILAGFFCDDSAGPPAIPAVGITNHGPQGQPDQPYFVLQAGVNLLWTTFYDSFKKFTFAPTTLELPGGSVPAPRFKTTVTAGTNQIPMIAVQCDLSGTYTKQWLPHNHHSPPLSHIPVASTPLPTHVAATAIFAFNSSNLITRMFVYMDRFKLQRDLLAGSPSVLIGFANGIEHYEKVVAEAKKRSEKN